MQSFSWINNSTTDCLQWLKLIPACMNRAVRMHGINSKLFCSISWHSKLCSMHWWSAIVCVCVCVRTRMHARSQQSWVWWALSCYRYAACLARDHPSHPDDDLYIPVVQLPGDMMTQDLVTKWWFILYSLYLVKFIPLFHILFVK